MTNAPNENEKDHIEYYGDPEIASGHGKVTPFLMANYIIWPIWGIIWFYLYWNGSWGWLDRGHWGQLQSAANTTFPAQNQEDPKKP